MYALVGLYLAVPFFQALFTTEDGRKIALYYVVLWLCCAVFYAYAKCYFGISLYPFEQSNLHYFFRFIGLFFTGLLFRCSCVAPLALFWGACLCVGKGLIYRFTKSWSLSLGETQKTLF